MRLLHFADLHLGMENYGTLDTKLGYSTRVRDYLAAFDQVIDHAIEHQVDAVLFAGDAFKHRDPSPTIQREFAKRIRRLAAAEIPTVLLVGNHDLPSIDARATPMDIYATLDIPFIYVARDPDVLRLETRGGPLQVVTLPWLSRNRLLDPEQRRNPDPSAVSRAAAEATSAILSALVDQLDPEIPAVLLAHLSIEGARLGSEQSIMLGEDLVLDTDELRVRAFDYVALGHIHQHQLITARPPTVYAGSLERIDFGEEREDKGFVLVDIQPGPAGERRVEWTFQPVRSRPFVTLRIKAVHEDPMVDVEREIEQRAADLDGAIVRAFIAVPPEREELLRIDEVRRMLLQSGAAYVAKVVRDVDLQVRPRIELRDHETLDPVAALEKWLSLRDLTENQRRRILEAGKALIQAERDGE